MIRKDIKIAVLERDRFTCQICGFVGESNYLGIEHIIPIRSGGSNSTDNLRTLCSKCNSSVEKLEMKEKNVDSKRLNKWVSEYFSSSVPEYLYHYTSLYAAKGILDTREIWLSNVRTMNDPDELSYGYRLISMALEELQKRSFFMDNRQALRNLIEVLKYLAEQKIIVGNAEIYLTCFSAAKNKIRQWVTYGDAANGVSVMFANKLNKNKNQIEKLLRARVFSTDVNELDVYEGDTDKKLPPDVKETVDLYKENFYGFKAVEYLHEDKALESPFFKELVLQLGEALNDLFSDSTNIEKLNTVGAVEYVKLIRDGAISTIPTNFFIKMALWALSVKHHHWEDEKEWRLILLLHSSKVNNYNTQFLIKPGMMVPFIKYFISPGDILEICLGPKTNKAMSHLALDYYIKANPVYCELKIIESDIKMA